MREQGKVQLEVQARRDRTGSLRPGCDDCGRSAVPLIGAQRIHNGGGLARPYLHCPEGAGRPEEFFLPGVRALRSKMRTWINNEKRYGTYTYTRNIEYTQESGTRQNSKPSFVFLVQPNCNLYTVNPDAAAHKASFGVEGQ